MSPMPGVSRYSTSRPPTGVPTYSRTCLVTPRAALPASAQLLRSSSRKALMRVLLPSPTSPTTRRRMGALTASPSASLPTSPSLTSASPTAAATSSAVFAASPAVSASASSGVVVLPSGGPCGGHLVQRLERRDACSAGCWAGCWAGGVPPTSAPPLRRSTRCSARTCAASWSVVQSSLASGTFPISSAYLNHEARLTSSSGE
mmetsp:Transcript_22494/g.70598  ORF Transcript_22494/g.70598 Transcript_22494/m.70598 type:complete len:203 (+) Transcript_22494:783-1391(+)